MDAIDTIMAFISFMLIALGLTFVIVLLGMALNTFVHLYLGWW
jgi:hypothetical protein